MRQYSIVMGSSNTVKCLRSDSTDNNASTVQVEQGGHGQKILLAVLAATKDLCIPA